jgi:hypothetical protein
MDFLFGTIREITDMPDGVSAAVALDTDDDHALCIRSNRKGENFGTHFGIWWLEKDKDQVDWLARMIGRQLQVAYWNGGKDMKENMLAELSGLGRLLKEL